MYSIQFKSGYSLMIVQLSVRAKIIIPEKNMQYFSFRFLMNILGFVNHTVIYLTVYMVSLQPILFGLAAQGILNCFKLLLYLLTCFWLQLTEILIPVDSSNKEIYVTLTREPKGKTGLTAVFIQLPNYVIHVVSSFPVPLPLCIVFSQSNSKMAEVHTNVISKHPIIQEESVPFSSVSQSCLTLQPHGLQHTRLPCPSPTPRACSDSGPSSR